MKTNSNEIFRYLYLIVGITVLLIFIGVGIYTYYMYPNDISNSPETWGQFGDYIGGILNPLLTIINICVFVTLTLVIQKITDKNNEATLETNKRIALMSMKHEELNHFKTDMDNNLNAWKSDLQNIEKIKSVLYGYNVLEYRMLFLFPELNDLKNNNDLRKYIVEALNSFEKGETQKAVLYHIPVSNIYGMLVSDLSKLVIK